MRLRDPLEAVMFSMALAAALLWLNGQMSKKKPGTAELVKPTLFVGLIVGVVTYIQTRSRGAAMIKEPFIA